MNDAMDGYLRQALKNWAAEQQPQANRRARLLLLAASPSAQRAYYENRQGSSIEPTQTVSNSINPVSDFYDLPLLIAVQLTYTTLRRVT